jgi:hypothetical protein
VGAAVPAGTPAGEHAVRTGCGGAGTFTVVAAPAAPTLVVTPARAQLPVTVTVRGTCAPGTTSVRLLVDGYEGGALDVAQATGEIQPITLELGTGTPVGVHRLTTTCGGSATFTALAAPATAAPTTPARTTPAPTTAAPSTGAPRTTAPSATTSASPALVRVPDLVGLTEQQAVHALGDQLHLAATADTRGRIRAQQPAAGSLVPPGSAVTAEFGTASPSRVPWVVAGAAAALLVVVLVTAWVLLRRRGGRRPPGPRGRGGSPTGPSPAPRTPPESLVGGPPA